MKVLYIIDSLQTGGAEKSILEIASRLKDVIPSVCILYSDKADLKENYIQCGIQIYELELKRNDKFWLLKGRKSFSKLVKDIQPDIVHAHLYKGESIARISRLPVKTVLVGAFVNDSYCKERYEQQSWIRNRKLDFIKLIDRITISKNNWITSITQTIADSNGKILHFPIQKVKVIYRGRDIQNYNYTNRILPPTTSFTFFAVGRLLIRKGYIELLNAIFMLKTTTQTPFELIIAGNGSDAQIIQQHATKLNLSKCVTFLGVRNDIPQLLAQSHCFVFASYFEGQGGSLVEAMLSGIPIVASDIDVFKEQVGNDFSAKLFQVGNAEDLAKQMQWVMENYEEAKRLGKNARKVAEEKFDIKNIAKQTNDFYLEICHP
jgi:glycosyltransferase involved in cell wall biosynthesis